MNFLSIVAVFVDGWNKPVDSTPGHSAAWYVIITLVLVLAFSFVLWVFGLTPDNYRSSPPEYLGEEEYGGSGW